MRLRELLGLSLDDLRTHGARPRARAPACAGPSTRRPRADERERILYEARGHIETQLALLSERRRTIEQMEQELTAKRARVQDMLDELGPA